MNKFLVLLLLFCCTALGKGKKVPELQGACSLEGTDDFIEVSGYLLLTVSGDGLRISGHIEGLNEGNHSLQVHEFGDMTDLVHAKHVEGIFNPFKDPHGCEEAELGNFGNIEAETEDIKTEVDISDLRAEKFKEFFGLHSIIGRSIVVRERADDCVDPKSSGQPMAQCVVGIAKVDKNRNVAVPSKNVSATATCYFRNEENIGHVQITKEKKDGFKVVGYLLGNGGPFFIELFSHGDLGKLKESPQRNLTAEPINSIDFNFIDKTTDFLYNAVGKIMRFRDLETGERLGDCVVGYSKDGLPAPSSAKAEAYFDGLDLYDTEESDNITYDGEMKKPNATNKISTNLSEVEGGVPAKTNDTKPTPSSTTSPTKSTTASASSTTSPSTTSIIAALTSGVQSTKNVDFDDGDVQEDGDFEDDGGVGDVEDDEEYIPPVIGEEEKTPAPVVNGIQEDSEKGYPRSVLAVGFLLVIIVVGGFIFYKYRQNHGAQVEHRRRFGEF